jgi:hypothetical protein
MGVFHLDVSTGMWLILRIILLYIPSLGYDNFSILLDQNKNLLMSHSYVKTVLVH